MRTYSVLKIFYNDNFNRPSVTVLEAAYWWNKCQIIS